MFEILADLAAWNLAAFGLFLLVVQIFAREVGQALGRRRMAEKDGADGVGIFVGSILGLLAFVLALNLSIATTRSAERRAGTLEEANAIGTAWLQAHAVGGEHGEAVAGLLERYLDLRRDYVLAARGSPRIGEIEVETDALQGEIWGHVAALVRLAPTPVSTSLMNSVNHVFDTTTAERFALAYSLPPQLLWLLLGVTIAGMGALGFQLGQMGRSHRILALFMSLVWTAVIVEIIDLGSGRIGSQRADPYAYDWTRAGFGEIPVPEMH